MRLSWSDIWYDTRAVRCQQIVSVCALGTFCLVYCLLFIGMVHAVFQDDAETSAMFVTEQTALVIKPHSLSGTMKAQNSCPSRPTKETRLQIALSI